MRLAGLKSFLLLFFFVALTGAIAGCQNPFDPLKSSDEIQGLTYIDFAVGTQSRWDSDPMYDGMEVTMNYYNEFGSVLSFHDKAHKIVIEIYSEQTNDADPPVVTREFIIAKTVEFSNSDDTIRIPIESYSGLLDIADPPLAITGCLKVSVFPPKEYPQKVLLAPIQCGVEIYTPEEVGEPL